MEGQLAVHLLGTDPEEPAKLTDREILNMNKKKKTNLFKLFSELLNCFFLTQLTSVFLKLGSIYCRTVLISVEEIQYVN